DASEADRGEAVAQLARQLVAAFGAPDAGAARPAAEEEIAFAAALAQDHPAGTLVALHRVFENGAVRETFRSLKRREGEKPLRAFAFMEVEGDEPGPEDQLDL